jgi:hypothetical protein
MAGFRSFVWALILSCTAVPLVRAQQAVTTIQLPNGRNAQITFTTIDVPGAGVTSVNGINGTGEIVGNYGQSTSTARHSFAYTGGVFTYFDCPGASFTIARAVNDAGLVVGYAEFQGGLIVRGFTYDGSKFTMFHHGTATYGFGIDNRDDIVGGNGSIYTTHGFELRGKTFRNLSPPGSYVYVYATAINDFGEVVGWTDYDGFVYKNGKFQTIDYPGASQTEAWGVNNGGTIVGWYFSGPMAFSFALVNGHYASFGYPGAVYTLAYGINASEQVVGSYTLDYKTYHGFVTSPIL